MGERAWKLHLKHWYCRPQRIFGAWVTLGVMSYPLYVFCLNVHLGPHAWVLTLFTRRRNPCLTKPGKPSSAG